MDLAATGYLLYLGLGIYGRAKNYEFYYHEEKKTWFAFHR
jgi:hypothetical protein